jgi:hypothetical protein
MLTEEEKQKIREELQYRQLLLDELRPAKSRGQKVSDMLAHPALITILGTIFGGMAISIVHQNAEADRMLARQVQLQDLKYGLLEKCCGEIECATTHLLACER